MEIDHSRNPKLVALALLRCSSFGYVWGGTGGGDQKKKNHGMTGCRVSPLVICTIRSTYRTCLPPVEQMSMETPFYHTIVRPGALADYGFLQSRSFVSSEF